MPSLAEVKKQIAAWPHRYIFWTGKEIRALPKILDEAEPVLAVTSGFMSGATWLLVLTDRRLIFLNRGMVFGLRQVQIPLDRVQSIDNSFTLVLGSISVWDGASKATINLVLKSSIMPFVRATEEAIAAFKQGQRGDSAVVQNDVTSQLMKLADLKERGHLTQAEFEAQKKKLLS